MTATITGTFRTADGQRIERNTTVTVTDVSSGTTFTGVSRGVCVSRGILYAAFWQVEGDVPTTGKDRWLNVPWHSIPAAQRPLVLGQDGA